MWMNFKDYVDDFKDYVHVSAEVVYNNVYVRFLRFSMRNVWQIRK